MLWICVCLWQWIGIIDYFNPKAQLKDNKCLKSEFSFLTFFIWISSHSSSSIRLISFIHPQILHLHSNSSFTLKSLIYTHLLNPHSSSSTSISRSLLFHPHSSLSFATIVFFFCIIFVEDGGIYYKKKTI